MKKLVLTSICTLAVAAGALAQGTVNWSINIGDFTYQTNSTQYSPLFGAGSTGGGAIGGAGTGLYYFELLSQAYTGNGGTVGGGGLAAQPATVSQLAGWSDTGLGGTNNVANGRAVTVGGSSQATPNGWVAGATNSIMIVGWSANLGSTYAAALATLQLGQAGIAAATGGNNAFFGESAVGYIQAGSGNPGPTIFAANQNNTASGVPIFSPSTQLYLLPVPEPSTIAMAAFGGLSLLALRRRK